MNKMIFLENNAYELLIDYKDGFDLNEIEKKYTDYFEGYDYILGDWSYGRLRLKGFCDRTNELYKEINDFAKKDYYLKDQCAYDCKYFVLKKKLPVKEGQFSNLV